MPTETAARSGRRLGPLLGLAAAASFGVSAPIAKLLLAEIPPQMLAAVLYLGAGVAVAGYRWVRPNRSEAPLRRDDAPALCGIVVLGGVIAPVLMLVGLTRVTGFTGSLLLNLEAPFTMTLAVVVFREHLGRRGLAAALLIVAAAAALRLRPGEAGADTLGVLAIAGACLCWGVDNNLTQRISMKDPLAVVRLKTLAAGGCNLVIALGIGQALPDPGLLVAAAMLGAVSYGASVVLDAYALRMIGAAREAAYFATAPFMGALAAVVLLHEGLAWIDVAAGLVMACGVVLMLRERHGHHHVHEALEHEHAHVHDEHHQHDHQGELVSIEPHTHRHQHAPIAHEHAHVSDAHHRHEH